LPFIKTLRFLKSCRAGTTIYYPAKRLVFAAKDTLLADFTAIIGHIQSADFCGITPFFWLNTAIRKISLHRRRDGAAKMRWFVWHICANLHGTFRPALSPA
jgi:hypothetical protein